jgi:hypothetical protein
LKARPARRAFVFLGRLLLGGVPPPFDQLQDSLAAVPQTLALLELVKHGDHSGRQLEQHLLLAGRRKAPPVGADVIRYGWAIDLFHR